VATTRSQARIEGLRALGAEPVVLDGLDAVAVWLPYLARVLGAPEPRHLPVWLARPAAGEVAVSMMTQIRGSANDAAKQELGWRPRWASSREGFRHGLAPDRDLRTGAENGHPHR
jgi:hypothetical protein